jgi:hypothetical protein
LGPQISRAVSAVADAWRLLPVVHRLSATALSVGYLCFGLAGLIWNWFQMDGQAMIFVRPFFLVVIVSFPASAMLALVGLFSRWKVSLVLLVAGLPMDYLVWQALKGF